MDTVPQFLQVYAAHTEGFVADQLGRGKFIDLFQKIPELFYLSYHKGPCGHICQGNAEPVGNIRHRHNIIIFCLIKSLGVEIRTGGDHPDHFPLYNTLGFFRILHLLADRHLISLFHQTVDISIRCMKGDAAHGRPLLQAAVLSRQSQLQFSGHGFRILEKHLVKISQTVK